TDMIMSGSPEAAKGEGAAFGDDARRGGRRGRELRLERQLTTDNFQAEKLGEMNLKQGVASMAAATQLGDYFQDSIDQPVNLPRETSALLPILGGDVEATRVSIYNQSTHAKFPLLGLKFKNTTSQHLMQGPLTVFDNNTYAGDARILDLQPSEERLLSY